MLPYASGLRMCRVQHASQGYTSSFPDPGSIAALSFLTSQRALSVLKQVAASFGCLHLQPQTVF